MSPRSRSLALTLGWLMCLGTLTFAGTASTVGAASAASSYDLKVGTFNVGGVQTDKSASGDHRPWRERRAGVANRIISRHLDVIGLQEANPSSVHASKLVSGSTQYEDVVNALRARGGNYAVTTSEPYNCARATSGTNCRAVDHGSALSNRIAYNRDTLSVVRKGSMRYDAQSAGKYVRYFEWAVFEIKETGKRFLFTNTHLDPYSPANREREWREALAETASLRGDLPTISVGDYNTTKFSTWAERTLPLTREYGLTDVLNQNFQKSLGKPRAEKTVHAWLNSFNGYRRDVKTWSYYKDKRKQGNVIDWIFASDRLRVLDYEVVARISDANLAGRGVFPSDHNLVRATIVIP